MIDSRTVLATMDDSTPSRDDYNDSWTSGRDYVGRSQMGDASPSVTISSPETNYADVTFIHHVATS